MIKSLIDAQSGISFHISTFLRGAGQAGKFPILYKFKSGLRGKRKPVLINSLALLSHFFLLDEGRN